MEKDFSQLATDESINIAKDALEKNGITVLIVENGAEAKEKVLQMIPEGAEIMNMSSVTVDSIGLSKEITELENIILCAKNLQQWMPKPRVWK